MLLVATLFTLSIGISSATLDFPKDFIWGTATSSYQIEGGWNANGKTPSNWDVITHNTPGKIRDKSNGDIACDSYHKYKEDVQMLRELGVDSYRFSLSWARLLPDGFPTKINADGVQYYNNLINELLRYNITPMVTIYHWDHPANFTDIGGWSNPILADLFVDYADQVFKLFGDRVKVWTTFNEPHSFCTAYEKNALFGWPYLCIHTVLRAHGKAYRLYKSRYPQGKVGIVLDSQYYYPVTNSNEDRAAAVRALNYDFNWIADPIFSKHGDYPQDFKAYVANLSQIENFSKSKLPEFTPEEIKEIQGSYDYLGFNHYRGHLIRHGSFKPSDRPSWEKDLNFKVSCKPEWPVMENEWCEYPQAIYDMLIHIKNRYDNPPVYITENGCADSAFNDVNRQRYYKGYLEKVSEAIKDGANVLGYYAWSLMDNFEWAEGYVIKFGLYQVNFTDPARTRTPRPSALWYQQLIKSHKSQN